MSRTSPPPRRRAQRIFDTGLWREDQPLRVVLIGTDFEVRVWETLLEDPDGPSGHHYSGHRHQDRHAEGVARRRRRGRQEPDLVRGAVPSRHSARAATLTGYHWGITRKRAMLGWEAGQVGVH